MYNKFSFYSICRTARFTRRIISTILGTHTGSGYIRSLSTTQTTVTFRRPCVTHCARCAEDCCLCCLCWKCV